MAIMAMFLIPERTSRLLLCLDALPVTLFLRFVVIIMVNKGFLDTNTAITRQIMWTARTLDAERRKFLL